MPSPIDLKFDATLAAIMDLLAAVDEIDTPDIYEASLVTVYLSSAKEDIGNARKWLEAVERGGE